MLLRRKETPQLQPDQVAVLHAYLDETGRVCVDAGAGTGKTTTLIETAAEVVARNITQDRSRNPFDKMLAVSFGVEASRKLKTELRKRLKDHVAGGGEVPDHVWRFLETEARIETIDAFIQSLMMEIAVLLHVAPSFDIATGLALETLVDEAIAELRTNPLLEDKWRRLEEAFPDKAYAEFPPEELRSMVWRTHQKLREFCWETKELRNKLLESLDQSMHLGKVPPRTRADLDLVVKTLGGDEAFLQHPDSQMIQYASETYERSKSLAAEFADLVEAFDRLYDSKTRERGLLTYIDIAYLVWWYTEKSGDTDWQSSLSQRFDDILIDEFQDTSHVQYAILTRLIRPAPPPKGNRVLIIGDVKQSIYQWRSADPSIFSAIIWATNKEPPEPPTPFESMVYKPLTSNFRSHPHLIAYYNALFSKLFTSPARGAISSPVPYVPLKAVDTGSIDDNEPRIHAMLNTGRKVEDWVGMEAETVARTAKGILDTQGVKVRKKGGLCPAEPGDIALLFRRTRHMPEYVKALRRAGLRCVVLSDASLFREPEVSLVIDLLDWLANPDHKDALLRILRSPLVALSDRALRYLASQSFYLAKALHNWPDVLPSSDRKRLEQLTDLRDDLRWDREGWKAELISRIVAHSYLDSVVLASENGLQAQANLWALMETVAAWEEESLLTYPQFVEILKLLRLQAKIGVEREYPRAIMADEHSIDSVKVMTVHAAKGLEFPIVWLAETTFQVGRGTSALRMVRNRNAGMALKPSPGYTLPIDQTYVERPGREPIPWVPAGEEEALLWISFARDPSSGQLVRNTPIDSALKEEIGEFWRLLYVAATRARDHLIFSVGDANRRDGWNDWMTVLRGSIKSHSVVSPTASIRFTEMEWTEEGKTLNVTVPVGFHDLPEVQPPATAPLPAPSLPTLSLQTSPIELPKYLPSAINPSTCVDLLECPRKYQYGSIWRDSGIRLRLASTGASPPQDITPEEWGRQVHRALRIRDFSVVLASDTNVLDNISKSPFTGALRRPTVIRELRKALMNFESLPVGLVTCNAAKSGMRIIREHVLNAALPIGGLPDILVQGTSDLIVERSPGEWILVDYKAEEKPQAGSYRERAHRTQIDAYSWLIEKSLGIRIKQGIIAYVHPKVHYDEVVPDPASFEEKMSRSILDLCLDPGRGLRATPSTVPGGVCTACAYSRGVGGPCEHG